MFGNQAQVFQGNNEYAINGFDSAQFGGTSAYGMPDMSNQMSQQVQPTGGIVAQSMNMNPYMTRTGKFRKPRQDEMIKEIQVFKGMNPTGHAVRVSDVNKKIRHCCTVRPYFHVLEAEKYGVILPQNEIEVIYYFHRDCGSLIIVGDSLSE